MFRGSGFVNLEGFELPATTLASRCYECIFYNCTSLTDASALKLPATTLAYRCYANMFRECYVLTEGPDELPATTLAE